MYLSIVIPAYNEEKRLPITLQAFKTVYDSKGLPGSLEVIVVDDGSLDGTGKWVKENSSSYPFPIVLVSFPVNVGKGHAVREGLKVADGDWVLICDADGSTPLEEYAKLASAGTDAAIASRALPRSQILIRQPGLRPFCGHLFNRFVRLLSGLPFQDTQCGFKLLSHAAVLTVRHKLRIDDFAWDIELLMLLRQNGFSVAEVPVRWEHHEDSRVRVLQDGLQMVVTVVKLRARFLRQRGKSNNPGPSV